MNSGSDNDSRHLLGHVLLPVATEDDARKTARSLAPYEPERVTVLHVVEKADGAPDKTPVEQSEQIAEAAFDAVREVFPDVNERVAYARDISAAIFDVADEIDASAIAFQSRGGGRLVHFLSGDIAFELLTEADLPIISLPRSGSTE